MMSVRGSPQLHDLGHGAFAVTGLYHPRGSVNAGFIITRESVVHIDAGMGPSEGHLLLKLSREKLPHPKKLYLILTHNHTDHIYGMRAFREMGAIVIGHAKLKEFLLEHYIKPAKPALEIYTSLVSPNPSEEELTIVKDVEISMPDGVIENDTALKSEGEEILLLCTPGHVPSEISIYHPASKTLFAGDTVYEGRAPNTRFGGPNEWQQWIESLRCLQALDITRIIPGHGRICDKAEIKKNIEHLSTLLRKGGSGL